MEGREHSGVILTTTSSATPAAVESGAADHGICFRISSGYDFGGVCHVTVYETRSDDVAAAEERVGAALGGTTESYSKIAEYGPISEGRTAGVVLVYTDCDDPAEEDAFNEWYSGHLHHTVESIDFYAATRYVSTDPSRTPSKYLAIYESQSADPAQVQKDGVDWWVKSGFEGPKCMVLRNEVPGERVD